MSELANISRIAVDVSTAIEFLDRAEKLAYEYDGITEQWADIRDALAKLKRTKDALEEYNGKR